jgi:hypothetical protein
LLPFSIAATALEIVSPQAEQAMLGMFSWIVIVYWQFDERVLDVLVLILNSLVS